MVVMGENKSILNQPIKMAKVFPFRWHRSEQIHPALFLFVVDCWSSQNAHTFQWTESITNPFKESLRIEVVQ